MKRRYSPDLVAGTLQRAKRDEDGNPMMGARAHRESCSAWAYYDARYCDCDLRAGYYQRRGR